LARPVYHGGLIEFVRKILRCVCNHCSQLLLSPDQQKDIEKIRSQTARFHRVVRECESIPVCRENFGGCGFYKPKYTKQGLGIDIEIVDDRSANPGADRKQRLMPEDAFRILSKISDYHCRVLGLKPVQASSAEVSAAVAGTSPGCIGRNCFTAVLPRACSIASM
jgi:DNA-directed RNA polymerase II subunit RPB1